MNSVFILVLECDKKDPTISNLNYTSIRGHYLK